MGCLKLTYEYEREGLEKSAFYFRSDLEEKSESQNFCTNYTPFGAVAKQWHNEDQTQQEDYRHDYQGQYAEKDEETGWNAFELRMYDPVIGRWLQVDPERQFASPYVAMGNNPMNQVDPTGGFSGKNPIKTVDNAPSISVGEDCYCTRVDYINELVWTAAAEGTYFSDSEDYIYGTLQSFDGFFGPELSSWEQFAVRLPTAGNIQKGGVVMYNSGVSGGGFGGQAENVTVVEDFAFVTAGKGPTYIGESIGMIVSSINAIGEAGIIVKEYFGFGKPVIKPETKVDIYLVRSDTIWGEVEKGNRYLQFFKSDTIKNYYSDGYIETLVDKRFKGIDYR